MAMVLQSGRSVLIVDYTYICPECRRRSKLEDVTDWYHGCAKCPACGAVMETEDGEPIA